MVYILDATSIAIIIPTAVLTGLLLAAAYRKRRSLWPMSEDHELTFVRRLVGGELTIFAVCFAVSAFLSKVLNFYQADCVLLTIPLICIMQFLLCKLITGKGAKSIIFSGQFVFTVSLIFCYLLLFVPITQSVLISLGFSFDNVFQLQQLSRIVVAVSTLPITVAGIALALHIKRHGRLELESLTKFVDGEDLSFLDLKTVEEVQILIRSALGCRQIEIADKISLYLLRRVECG